MKVFNNILTIAAATLLCGCTDILVPVYTVGEVDNAIVLSAGVGSGQSGVQTKAVANPDADHAKHRLIADGAKMFLRIDGDWKKTDAGAAETISKTTTATIGGETSSNSKHNTVSMNPRLFWDDYGTADPHNASAGRTKGLSIYGAGVNKSGVAVPVIDESADGKRWTDLTWSLELDQTAGWESKDLITSNNVVYNATESLNNTYTFAQQLGSQTKLLEFTHAMTKVTVQLTAGEGFVDSKFAQAPTVKLLNFHHTGKIDVERKITTPTAAVGEIKMYNKGGGANATTATFEALVYPGDLNNSSDVFADGTRILTLSADGNEYHVTAAKLNTAIKAAIDAHATTNYPIGSSNLSAEPKEYDLHLLQAWNYKLIITVNKTGIDVTATIKDWEDVTAANEAPKIVIDKTYGGNGSAPSQDMAFSFFRSLNKNNSYGDMANVRYTHSGTSYKMTPQLYWPDHKTHYFFRGIWPALGNNEQTEINQAYTPVAKVTDSKIEVGNVKYNKGTYPSDLMLAMPRKSDDGTPDETCKVDDHKTGDTYPEGICATTGKISMDFRYMMSQVVVKLTTSTGADQVTIDENTTVELTGGYKEGSILLGTGAADFTGKSTADYGMTKTASYNTSGDGYHAFHDAIIPQSLEDVSHNPTLKFRITVKQGESYDKYETILGIKDIPVNGDQRIISWEPGKKYIYNLKVTKSDIKVEARITDWTTTEGGTTIWM